MSWFDWLIDTAVDGSVEDSVSVSDSIDEMSDVEDCTSEEVSKTVLNAY